MFAKTCALIDSPGRFAAQATKVRRLSPLFRNVAEESSKQVFRSDASSRFTFWHHEEVEAGANHRKKPDAERFMRALPQIAGSRITWNQLMAAFPGGQSTVSARVVAESQKLNISSPPSVASSECQKQNSRSN